MDRPLRPMPRPVEEYSFYFAEREDEPRLWLARLLRSRRRDRHGRWLHRLGRLRIHSETRDIRSRRFGCLDGLESDRGGSSGSKWFGIERYEKASPRGFHACDLYLFESPNFLHVSFRTSLDIRSLIPKSDRFAYRSR